MSKTKMKRTLTSVRDGDLVVYEKQVCRVIRYPFDGDANTALVSPRVPLGLCVAYNAPLSKLSWPTPETIEAAYTRTVQSIQEDAAREVARVTKSMASAVAWCARQKKASK